MTIRKILLSDTKRLEYTASHFDDDVPFRIEPFIFNMASTLSRDYTERYWHFYELTNGAFYMAPDEEKTFQASCMNGYEGKLSADAFGITVSLHA